MLKLLFSIALFTLQPKCQEMMTVREKFHEINDSKKLEAFIEMAKNTGCENASPYIASCIMRRAEYVGWPIKKWNYFQEGKNMLEEFISHNPKNIEARYVRFLVQSQTPSFLGYNENQNEDVNFIQKNINDADIPQSYKSIILSEIEAIQKK